MDGIGPGRCDGEYRFTIEGEPKAQKQTRFRIVAGKALCYDPSSGDKRKIQKAIKPLSPKELLTCPISLTLGFFLPIPKSVTKAARKRMIDRTQLPDKKPDEDNLAYLVTNALKGYVYDDDRRICAKHVYKFYGEVPRTEIIVRPIFSLQSLGYYFESDL